SGIARSTGRGLVVSDELSAAQAAHIDPASRSLAAGPPIPLFPEGSGAEADLEGVTASADGRWFFVTGSHGVGRKKGDAEPSRCLVFRIPALPGAEGGFGTPGSSAGLHAWAARNPVLGPYVGRPLQRNGFNIEGLAWREGRLWFGVRAPSLEGDAFVIEADADALFGGTAPTATLHRVKVGAGLGLRELAAVRDGFILLAGEACAEASKQQPESLAAAVEPGYSLVWWRPGAAPVSIGRLPEAPGKPEGLLVLREVGPTLDLLVLHDGEPQGAPRAFRLHRP
ncbi:MAG: DUF3616 domain-containing protein, partial [Verrucomicrobia bacterium]|nr:DUF3616 domain-containing protein [Verrucomicrobiota bacterium]